MPAAVQSLKQLVDGWLDLDQNEGTRNEVEALLKAGNVDELEKRMRNRITFGTAGLRGRMEAGWSRMNDLVIIQASQGLCAYVVRHVHDATSRGVVIGHDHRHNSERWAKLAAAAFIFRGVSVYLHRKVTHTPMVPFSVKRLNAACGVMITASHNPKWDNGYKVYWENAVQIIGPHDKGIAASIEANLKPQTWVIEGIESHPLCADVTGTMCDAYFDQLASMIISRSLNASTPIRFVNTSVHGVSDPFVKRAFELFGFPPYIPVREQQDPDPEFPTVHFPNPEEKGCLDLALKIADREGADYVLAQDPDADRFAAVEKGTDGRWIAFTGDQLGSVFAGHCLEAYMESGKPMKKLAMVASIVSSRMIEAMARREGFKFVECLTGFKFVGNTALDLVQQGFNVPFGYEEAIGFMFGTEIRDKDGVAATVAFAQLAASLHSRGQTVHSYLQELYKRYGFFETSNSYYRCNDPPTIDRIFSRIRMYNPAGETPNYPQTIGGLVITNVIDLTTGYTYPPDIKSDLPLSSGQMIQFRARREQDDIKITLTLRTSGTEPKIKYYLEGSGENKDEVHNLLPVLVSEMGNLWLEATKHGLVHAL